MKVAIYLRVSTADQTTLNQELELKSYCERNDYEIFKIYKDSGIVLVLDLLTIEQAHKRYGRYS